MTERFLEQKSAERGLEGARKRRKQLMETLTDSPWKWALMAVMALESQGCASFGRVARYAALEPGAATQDWDVKFGNQNAQDIPPSSEREGASMDANRGLNIVQTGTGRLPPVSYMGPRMYFEYGPPGVKPSIARLPEGFNGTNPEAVFAVAHGSPRARTVTVTAPNQEPWRFGEVEEKQDVGVQSRMRRQPGVSDADRLNEVMRTKVRPSDIYTERHNVAAQAVKMLLPNMLNRRWGVRLEWQEVQRPDQGQAPRLTISCRTSPWAAPAVESASRRAAAGHHLEHDVLSNNRSVWANLGGDELYFSPEKSGAFPQRPAQAAFVSKPIKLEQWNQTQALLADSKRRLEAMPKSEASMSRPEVVRHRAALAELRSEIKRLTSQLDSAFNQARLIGMGATLTKFLPLIHDNELRFYVRFDEAHESMQVIALLDDPDISKI